MSQEQFTERDRAIIRDIQERMGISPTGTIDTEMLLSLEEILNLSRKLLIARFRSMTRNPERASTLIKPD